MLPAVVILPRDGGAWGQGAWREREKESCHMFSRFTWTRRLWTGGTLGLGALLGRRGLVGGYEGGWSLGEQEGRLRRRPQLKLKEMTVR